MEIAVDRFDSCIPLLREIYNAKEKNLTLRFLMLQQKLKKRLANNYMVAGRVPSSSAEVLY